MAMFLVPGDRIVPMGEGVAAGPGTYVHGSHIQSSLYGERYDITDESTGTCTITVRSIDNKSVTNRCVVLSKV